MLEVKRYDLDECVYPGTQLIEKENGRFINFLDYKDNQDKLKADNWISIKDQPLPKDPLVKIIRWNIIHKCSVSVRYYPKHNKDMPWVVNDLSHCWPEESFAPYWKPECEAPLEDI